MTPEQIEEMSKRTKPREWWLATRGRNVVLLTDHDEIHQARLGWAGWRAVLVREVLPTKRKGAKRNGK